MYYAQIRTEANELLIRWKRAWDDDDAAALSKFYAPDASYLPPASPPIQTRTAIRDYLAAILPVAGDLQIRLEAFGTSGDLAYLTARLSHGIEGSSGMPGVIVHTDVLVLRRHLDKWEIEMHFSRDEPEAKRGP